MAQEWSGTMIYDVRYDGQGYTADTRTALTPEGLDMHNDSSMGEAPANYRRCYACRRRAKVARARCRAPMPRTTISASSILSCCRACISRSIGTSRSIRRRMSRTGIRSSQMRTGGLRIRFNIRPIRRGYEKTARVLDNEGAEAVGR